MQKPSIKISQVVYFVSIAMFPSVYTHKSHNLTNCLKKRSGVGNLQTFFLVAKEEKCFSYSFTISIFFEFFDDYYELLAALVRLVLR